MRQSVVWMQRQYQALSHNALNKLREAKWKTGEELIWKRFAMPSHTEAARFAFRVAEHADKLNHHPEIKIKYRFITFELRTNDTGSLSQYDEQLAYTIDRLKHV